MFDGSARVKRWGCLVTLVVVCLLIAPQVQAAKDEGKTPRILLVGDSWPWFLNSGQLFWVYDRGSAFKDALYDYQGGKYARWDDWGDHTALGGTMVTQWSTNELTLVPGEPEMMGKLDIITLELNRYPTLDIVHLCFGGNDYIRGDYRDYIDYEEYQWQTIAFYEDPTGGTFTLTFEGETTDPIPFDAGASEVQSALEALSAIGPGNIEVIPAEGLPTYFCMFVGIFDESPVPMMTANGSGLTGPGGQYLLVHGVRFDHGWKETWGTESPAELAFATAIAEQMQIVVEHALDARPDVRLLMCDYDYMDEDVGGATQLEANTALVSSGRIKLEVVNVVAAKPQYANRVFYHNTFGLMQWTFGYPCDFEVIGEIPYQTRIQTTDPEAQIYGPMGAPGTGGTISLPGAYPDYDPWYGGDLDYPGPAMAILFNFGKDARAPQWAKDGKGGNIHLHKQGNIVYAKYCMDKFYAAWLDLPKAVSVEPASPHPILPGHIYNPTGAEQVAFEVTFSEPVTGVDVADFEVAMGGGVANASVLSVTPSKDATTYTVEVDSGSGDGTLGLNVLDNGSITALDDGSPLNGGVTGYFGYGGAYTMDRSVGLPVAWWSVALALLAGGVYAVRRRSSR